MAQVRALTVSESVASHADRKCTDTAVTNAVAQVRALTVQGAVAER